jgi:signal transduction histidine kinase
MALIDSHRLDGGGDLPPEQIDKIEQYVLSSLDVSNSFVQLSQAKAVAFKVEEMAMGDLLEVSIDEVWPQALLAEVDIFNLVGDAHSLAVQGDFLLLRRAIVNLLNNAIKFSPRGGQVTLSVVRLESGCRLEIQDQGPGLNPELEAQLFKPFVTSNQSLGAHATAIGLGLRMVHVVAERHGGRAGFLKNPNTPGACFYIELPLAL